ncbi:MAG: DoxX family membrane protein [Bacteroidota bacterium]
MEIVFLIGRILLGGYSIFNGLNHFIRLSMMTEYAKVKGVPVPSVAVAVTGLMLLLGGFSILLGAYPAIGVILLVAFLIPVSFIMHDFWKVSDPQTKMIEMVNFTKNLALAGATLMLLAIEIPWKSAL